MRRAASREAEQQEEMVAASVKADWVPRGAAKAPLLSTGFVGDLHILTLRQSRMGEGNGGSTSWGPKMWWWDQWLGWGWAGHYSPVYFCLCCQLGGGGVVA